ncbi:hypothetical protein [Mycobacterium sp. HUMS_1102779]
MEAQPDRGLLHVELDRAQRDSVEDQAALDAERLFEERLKSGDPVTAPKWMLGGHSVPVPKDLEIFRDRSVRSYRVYPNDRIEIAERYDDSPADWQ